MTGFTPAVRDTIRAGAQRSAAVIVPYLLQPWCGPKPSTVLDVGCGEGWFGAEFARHGVSVLGIDHPDTWGGQDITAAPIQLAPVDLAREGSIRPGLFDMTLCLEVAEHLPPARAASFVAELCATAPRIVFSAAIPGQGGVNHVNEQWPGYWVDLFDREGYACVGSVRDHLWNDDRVEPWYAQNLFLAFSPEAAGRSDYEMWRYDSPPRALVHPTIWEAYR